MDRQRNSTEKKISSALYYHQTRYNEWADQRLCLLVTGQMGSGKTTVVLNGLEHKKYFYFSFKGVCSELGRKLLFKELTALQMQPATDCWTDIFDGLNQLAKSCKIFIFDDLDEIIKEKDFVQGFQAYIDNPNRNRVFMVLIHTTGKSLAALSIPCCTVETKYQAIAEIKKAHPKRTGTELVELFTLSGGIPKIIAEFQKDLTIEENLKQFLIGSSAFMTFAWEILSFHYRRPETYAFILFALALGSNRISEVGKFTGYPYNKCDKYIKSLIEVGLVKAERHDGKSVYTIVNSYFQIWFRYIYPYQSKISEGTFFDKPFEDMVDSIRTADVPTAFTAACFETLRRRVGCDLSVKLTNALAYKPVTVKLKNEEYTFDFAGRDKGKAVFVKIFHDESLTIGKEEYEKLERAVAHCHPLSDSYIYIFAKRRFSDFLVHEASFGIVKLFNLDRLRFRE